MNAQADTANGAAPLPYQAEVLRHQVLDRIKRDLWEQRSRILRDLDDKLEAVNKDSVKLTAADFIAKYRDMA